MLSYSIDCDRVCHKIMTQIGTQIDEESSTEARVSEFLAFIQIQSDSIQVAGSASITVDVEDKFTIPISINYSLNFDSENIFSIIRKGNVTKRASKGQPNKRSPASNKRHCGRNVVHEFTIRLISIRCLERRKQPYCVTRRIPCHSAAPPQPFVWNFTAMSFNNSNWHQIIIGRFFFDENSNWNFEVYLILFIEQQVIQS